MLLLFFLLFIFLLFLLFFISCLVDSPKRNVAEAVLAAPDCAFLEGAMTVSQYRVN